jgi:hypothetical protein
MACTTYGSDDILTERRWTVEFAEEFEPELDELPEEVQDEILAHSVVLEQFGPLLGRPRVDTLSASKHANMKERIADKRFDRHLARLKAPKGDTWDVL